MNTKNKKNLIILLACSVIIFGITYSVVASYFQDPYSDFSLHTKTAELVFGQGMMALLRETSYPLFQLLVAIIAVLLRAPYSTAAAIGAGLLNVLTYIFIQRYLSREHDDIPLLITVVSLLFMFIGPLYAPWFNQDVYLGQGTPNIWHNPTTMCVRPFALITFVLIIDILGKYEKSQKITKRTWGLLTIMILVCNFAKPSFLQIIVPGLGIYLLMLLIRTKGNAIGFCFKLVLTFIPSACVMLWQLIVSFTVSSSAGEGAGIGISWFEVLTAYTPNLAISMLLVFAFPIYILITHFKYIKEIDVQLAIFMCVSGFLEAAMLVEGGSRRLHGNLGWGYILSMFFVYLIAFKYFIQKNKEYDYTNKKERIVIAIGWIFIFIQLLVGLYYINILK